MRKLLLSALGAVAFSAALTGAAEARWYPVPRARVEVVPVGRPGYIWRPGYYNYYGGRYVWTGGAYVVHRPEYGRWAPGYWDAGHRHWYGPHWVR